MSFNQSRVTLLTVVTYFVILRTLLKGSFVRLSLDDASKVVSFSHSLAISIAAIYALNASDWQLTNEQEQEIIRQEQSNSLKGIENRNILDDSQNIIINGRSPLAKDLLAWEAGYLLYDTIALCIQSRQRHNVSGLLRLVVYTLRDSRDILVHHILIFSGLASLPAYFSIRRELGTWIFTSFLLMNASTPVLHARTWFRRRYGKRSETLEFSFILLFAMSRFGLVYWVIDKYAQYHNLSFRTAFGRLYLVCKTGTLALVGFNAIWWLALVRNFMKRAILQRRKPQ